MSVFTEVKRSLRLSLPLVAAQLIYALNGFISTIMVAHLGKNALAANALVWTIFVALILFFIGILNAVSVLVAQSYGANDNQGVRFSVSQGFILAIIFAVPMILAMLIAPEILSWTGQNPKIIKLATPYFHSLIWCMLPLNLLIVMEQFLIGISLTKLVLCISILEVPLEMFFFYILIFGKFGMPAFGLSGIGYGMAIGISLAVMVASLYLGFSKKCSAYKVFANFCKINRKYLLELMRVGMPLGGMYCIEVTLFAVVAIMMGRFGSDVLAAHQIAYQCFIFTLTVVFGLSQGATVRVSHEVGRNNKSVLKLVAYTNMGIAFVFVSLIDIFYVFFPKMIISLDINVHEQQYQALTHYATIFLAIAALLQLSDCFRLIGVGVLRGLKDTKIPMYVSLVAFWLIAFPISYLLAFVFHFNGAGIWWGMVIGLVIAAIVLLLRFNRLVKRIDLTALVTR